MPRLLLPLLAALVLTAACGRDQEPTATLDPAGVELFSRIDADSPYVMANLERLPDDLVDLFWSMNAAFLGPEGMTPDIEDDDLPDPVRALLAELGGLTDRAAFERTGLRSDGMWALHGISAFPVLHWELLDSVAFAATMDRIAAATGEAVLSRRMLDDISYTWLPLGRSFGLAAHHDQHLATIALLPDDAGLKRRAFGVETADSPYDPAQHAGLNRDYGYTPYGSGFVDWGKLAGLLFDQATPSHSLIGNGRFAADHACRSEYTALTRALPRMVSGYTRVDTTGAEFSLRQETSAELGRSLKSIADTPAGLGTGIEGEMGFGASVNLVALRDFLRKQVGVWVDNPPACAAFARISDQAPDWQLALNRPIPPVVTNIHGFRVALGELPVIAAGHHDARGTVVVFMRNPELLLGMIQMFSPELAALDLAPGREPRPLPAGLIPQLEGTDAFIALSKDGLGLAMGAEFRDSLPDALKGRPTDGTILIYTVEPRALGQWMESIAGQAGTGEHLRHAPVDTFERLGRVYERLATRVRLDDRGIEIVTAVEFLRH